MRKSQPKTLNAIAKDLYRQLARDMRRATKKRITNAR